MKVNQEFTIVLTESEAIALKKWLSTRSDNAGKEAGIDSEGNIFLSNLYDELPYEQ